VATLFTFLALGNPANGEQYESGLVQPGAA
jgi:hypothetical protein